MKKIFFFGSLIVLAFILSACEPGTSGPVINIYGSARGYVYDYNNNPVQGAVVTIDERTDITGPSGSFYITHIVRGYHDITAGKDGYIGLRRKDVRIYADEINDIEDIYILGKDKTGSISGSITSISNTSLKKNINAGNNTKATNISDQIDSLIPAVNSGNNLPDYVKGEVLVKFRPEVTAQQIENQSIGKVASISRQGIFKIKSRIPSTSTEELYKYYQERSDVEAVSFNHIGQLATIPDDTFVNNNGTAPTEWNVFNTNLPLAWDIERGSYGVTVAVIDTGYVPHPDLNTNINTSLDYDFVGDDPEVRGDEDDDAIDEDSYYTNSSDYLVSHGTHVAGIIGAVGNNTLGVAGVNWNVDIMPIRIFKYVDGVQYFEEYDLTDAIGYAIDNGADVINLSLVFRGDYSSSGHDMLETALEDAYNQGVTVVAAAGNDATSVYYPATSQYTIAVAASTLDNQLTSYSNYGSEVDIIAPGGDANPDHDYNNDGNSDMIISTHNYYNRREDKYMFMAGTSMAAPMVSGVAALLYAQGIDDPGQIKEIIKESATPLPGLDKGLLNAYGALTYLNSNNTYDKMRIMAAVESGDEYYVMSSIAGADGSGDYNLKYVQANYPLDIIGWIDTNEDEIINNGDYFGEYGDTIKLTPKQIVTGINFGVSYQTSSLAAVTEEKHVHFGPPPAE